ncbi:RelE toxin of RelE / RelB toxin-antitoxin system [Algoriphagus locisalis]|uniref:RelE toxin of RelE / RelB toxin-antitoxin system n=1 Tax=Algoriphagus locisalis TaxID=305507 RepID=A0A1I7D6W2_9BACT|nr:type II toxin-antitoxin system RelE/ParE family toxin [Algoriphagus locisalis]SFU07468.1 RelE toxin of RelE / RelB toxin-antitoxin system [Algoriphagus locisalis]
MSYKVLVTNTFQKDTKRLFKKYPSIKSDLQHLIESLETDPTQGTSLGNNLYKIRLSIGSTGKGKSGGARVISLVKIIREEGFLIALYSKSEKSSISMEELRELITKLK